MTKGKTMKILHVAETIKGGVASVINTLIVFQAKKDTVCVLIPDSQANELNKIANCQQYYFRRTGRNMGSFLSLLKQFFSFVIKEKPDVVHIHSSFAGVIARFALMVLYPIRRPIVIYCPHAFSFIMPNSNIKRQGYIWIERLLQPITDKIICTSQFELQQAIACGMNKHKLQVIYNGIDLVNITTPSPYLNNQKIHLLFVGRFDRQKGYDLLLQLIKKLDKQRFDLTIIGAPVHDNVEKLTQSNVVYKGWLTYKEIIPYFQHAAVLLMPSRWESFGLVAVEAQSFGLPVVANHCSSLPEVILDKKTGYLVNFEKDIDNIVELLNNMTIVEWQQMKSDCIQFATSYFSAEKMNEAIDDLYNNLNDGKKQYE
jgi:glycosyltransferase involved in cell wall biosynthesis